MRKYAVSTSKGLIHTNDFKSAMKILEMEYERKRELIEKEKREQEALQKEMLEWLEKNIPQTKEEILKAKYEGGF